MGYLQSCRCPQSLATEQGYTEQLGLITAGFYEVPGTESPRGQTQVGTGRGEKRRGEIEEYREGPVGRCLGVVNIRYVTPDALEALRNKQVQETNGR